MIQIAKYEDLLASFVIQKVAAGDFERDYLETFKSEVEEMSEDIYHVLNDMFTDVDAYCGNPAIRDENDLDEEQLRSSAAEKLKRLRALARE